MNPSRVTAEVTPLIHGFLVDKVGIIIPIVLLKDAERIK